MNTVTIKIAEIDQLVRVLDALSKHLELNGTLQSRGEWMQTEEVLEVLGITRKTLYTKRIRGELGYSKIGKRVYFRRSDVMKLLQSEYEPAFHDARKLTKDDIIYQMNLTNK